MTISTDPGGVQRTYWYDAAALVTRSSGGTNPPAVALPDGGLWDLRGRTLPGGAHELTITATDSTGGIRAIYVDMLPTYGDVVFSGGGCVSDCPQTVTSSWTLDTVGSYAGQTAILVTVVDGTGATSTRSFTVTMPTPPPIPPGESPIDPDPPASEEAPITTAECEQEHGAESSLCFDPNPQDDPTRPDGGEGFGLLSARTLRWGIAQHGPSQFVTTPRFVDLGPRDRLVRYLKLNVPYNLMERVHPPDDNRFKYPERIREFDEFYRAAIAAIDRDSNGDGHTCRARFPGDHCMELMVAFELRLRREDPDRDGREEPFEGAYLTDDDTRTDENKNYLPFKRAYIDPIQAFKRRFPRTKVISAWNEPNHRTQPTRYNNPGAREDGEGGPARAAYYTVLVSKYVCRNAVVRCWVAAGDFSQNGVEISYFNDYRRALARKLARNPGVPAPGIWAFHPYTDVRRGDERRRPRTVTSRIIDDLPGNVRFWLSEVGSRVDTDGNRAVRRNRDATQAAEVTYLVDRLATSRRQIDRVYYYSLCAPADRSDDLTTFDSGLLGDRNLVNPDRHNGTDPGPCSGQQPRDAYGVYQRKTGGPPTP